MCIGVESYIPPVVFAFASPGCIVYVSVRTCFCNAYGLCLSAFGRAGPTVASYIGLVEILDSRLPTTI